MKRFTLFVLVGLLGLGSLVSADSYSPSNVNIDGSCDWYVKEYSDSLGEVIRTIPIYPPGTNNAFTGATVVGDTLFIIKNVVGPLCYFQKFNLVTGDTIGLIPMPFSGYCMGAAYDGSGIWVAQFYPTSTLYKIGLDGSQLAQITPSFGDYSGRALGVEGDNIWVGGNAAQNDTKLFKINAAGTILEEYVTSSMVGWYMDGVLNTEAPANSNIYVVDNIGMLIKRLSISGGAVTVTEQFYTPVIANDVCEGLAHDGEYLWHNAASSLQGLIWCIDDGITGGPNVVVDLTPTSPPVVIPAGGGSFGFTAQLANNEATPMTFDAWIDVTLPNGATYGPILNRNLTTPAGAQISRTLTQVVPGAAPPGTYSYNGYVGLFPNEVWDSDNFEFTKTGADGSGGLEGWNLTGWEGESLTVSALPTEFSLSQNYPNPFNPTTQISFALPKASEVSLKVYNTLGKLVEVVVEGYMPAGVHTVTLSGENLSSGIYLYSIQAGEYRMVKKMTFLK